jgi:putative peptidoglycan lipid II flippase
VTGLADAYNTANTLPNMLFMLVTGGTLSAVVLPMLAREPDDDRRRERAAVLGGAILTVTGAASILLAAAAPLLARGFAVSRQGDAEYASFVAATTSWIILFAPQILFYGWSVHAVAVLNARGRLALAGFAPVLANLVTILAVAGYLWSGGPQPPSLAALEAPSLIVLGAGTTLGVAAMSVTQWLGARRAEAGLRLRFDLRHPAIGELWRLGRWTLGYVVVNQLGLAVVLTLANSADGGVAAYQWAFAIMQLPYAVIAVSMLSAVYPRLARTADDDAGFARHVAGGIRLTVVLLVPAAVGLVLLADPITSLLLGYGAAAGSGAAFVADALRWFGAALVPFCLYQLLTRSFYARSDTRTPMLANVGVNLVNVAAGVAAFVTLGNPARGSPAWSPRTRCPTSPGSGCSAGRSAGATRPPCWGSAGRRPRHWLRRRACRWSFWRCSRSGRNRTSPRPRPCGQSPSPVSARWPTCCSACCCGAPSSGGCGIGSGADGTGRALSRRCRG